MLDFVKEAGVMALEYMADSQPGLKADGSIITKTDKAVSQLLSKKLNSILKEDNHILVDEESEDLAQYFDQTILEKVEYVWAVDPIDGTRNYANKTPLFGISIGLLKNLKPYLGVVYFPLLKELFYCDGEQSYFMTQAFSDEAKKTLIEPIDEIISNQSTFIITESFFRRFQWDYKDCHLSSLGVAVADMCWPTIGRTCGAMMGASFWDFAGAWPIIQSAGLNMYSVQTGTPLKTLHKNIFRKDRPWKLKDYYIICSQRNLKILQEKIG